MKELLVIAAVNSFLFMIVRIFKRPRAEFTIVRQPHHKHMAYLVGAPREAFAFLEPHLKDGVTLIKFNPYGWDAEKVAMHIMTDIAASRYHATVYTMFGGDRVGEIIDAKSPLLDLEIFAINPCPTPDLLMPAMRTKLKKWLIIFETTCMLTGFFSMIPVATFYGHEYSICLLRDTFRNMLTRPKVRHLRTYTKKVLTSATGNFTDAKRVQKYYRGARIAFISEAPRDLDNISQACARAMARL